MTGNGKKKINKKSTAQYKWIKYMFARQDELIARLEKLEKEIIEIKKRLNKENDENHFIRP